MQGAAFYCVVMVLCMQDTFAIMFDVDIMQVPYLTFLQSSSEVQWNQGAIAELQSTHRAVRINNRGVFFVPHELSVRLAESGVWKAHACYRDSRALCTLPSSGSKILPNKKSVPQTMDGSHRAAIPQLEPVIRDIARRHCTRPENGRGRQLTHRQVYDLSVCDLGESNIDIVFMGDMVYVSPNNMPVVLYAILGLVALYLIIVLAENISNLLDSHLRKNADVVSCRSNDVRTKLYLQKSLGATSIEPPGHNGKWNVAELVARTYTGLRDNFTFLVTVATLFMVPIAEQPHVYTITDEERYFTMFLYVYIGANCLRYVLHKTGTFDDTLSKLGEATFAQYNILLAVIYLIMVSLYSTLQLPYSLGFHFMFMCRFRIKMQFLQMSLQQKKEQRLSMHEALSTQFVILITSLDAIFIAFLFYITMLLQNNYRINVIPLYFLALNFVAGTFVDMLGGHCGNAT